VNAVVELKQGGLVESRSRMAVADVVQQAMAIQEIMKAVMREGVHYGTIPGTDKPTLYKAGAEKLCLTFHVADRYVVEDLSAGTDAIRYRVTCIGTHQHTGVELGQGIGEASTGEEKYRWRRAVCKEEFEATPQALRRVKFAKGRGGSFYTQEQVRTEPADLANTVLKMAAKRAKMAMVLNVLAASDAFTQDLEDLSDELREHLTEDEREAARLNGREVWLTKVGACNSLEDLAVLAAAKGPAVAWFQKSNDTTGYGQFSKAVRERGAALRASAAPPPAPPAAEAQDPFVAEMNAAEGAARE